MPTYDYVCSACDHALEIFHAMSAAPKRKCPQCGKQKLERRIGPGAGFLFKGAGFYLTDYRSESYRAGEKAETSAAPAATTDAKPAENAPGQSKDTSAKDSTSDAKTAAPNSTPKVTPSSEGSPNSSPNSSKTSTSRSQPKPSKGRKR